MYICIYFFELLLYFMLSKIKIYIANLHIYNKQNNQITKATEDIQLPKIIIIKNKKKYLPISYTILH